MTRRDRIDRFITRWHRGEWSIPNLPAEIGARVGYFSRGSLALLGCCDVRRGEPSLIALNAGLIGTPWLVPVLAHECAHVLISRVGYHACRSDRAEARVWALAARLCVPETVRQAILDGAACSDGVARAYGLPAGFIFYAVHGNDLLDCWLDELRIHVTA